MPSAQPLTLSENLADLAGLGQRTTPATPRWASGRCRPTPTGSFFTGYAQSWRSKLREASLRRGVLTDGHAPASYRTATVRNIDAWYTAFNVQPGQALYLAPAERVRVW